MAKFFHSICFLVLSILLLLQFTVSEDSPINSPTPPPESSSDSPSPLSHTPISIPPDSSPVKPPSISPPSPPPSDSAPDSSPAPSPPPPPPQPSFHPSAPPSDANDVNHVSKGDESDEKSKSKMNGGQKFGIAFGVIAAVAVVGFGVMVYKKRRDNIERSRYGYTARREIL